MAPPYRRNPIRDARDTFYGDPLEAEFFPPVGQGRTAFGAYVSPTLAANTRMDLNKLAREEDDAVTKEEENFTRRLELGSRNRVLPYSEEATVAQQRLQKTKAESDIKNNPFYEREDAAESQFRTAGATAALEDLPETRKLQGLQRQDAIEALESGEQDVQRNKIDPLAYDFSLREVKALNPRLPQKELQRLARNNAMKFNHDQPYVEAIEEEAFQSGDPRYRAKFLEDIMDPETGARFTRIRKDANPAEVAALHRKNTYNRARAAQERETRMTQQADERQRAIILDKLADGVREQIKAAREAGETGKLPDLMTKLAGFESRLEKMISQEAPSQMDDVDLAKPGK